MIVVHTVDDGDLVRVKTLERGRKIPDISHVQIKFQTYKEGGYFFLEFFCVRLQAYWRTAFPSISCATGATGTTHGTVPLHTRLSN